MADPKKLFVVNAITREEIANDLNNYLDCNGAITSDRLQPDDDRLTDAICEAYSKDLGNIETEVGFATEAMVDENVCALQDRILKMIGIDPANEETTGE